jgi:hypothetical protein
MNRRRFALLLTLGGVAGCASTQPHETSMLLIDRLPVNFGSSVKLLRPEEHKEDQQALLTGVEKQLHSKFLITAERIIFIHEPPSVIIIQAPHFRMDINSIMYQIDEQAECIFEKYTGDNPSIEIWKTGRTAPEYTAIAYYTTSGKNYDVLVGYFQLQPVQQESK